MRLDGRSDAVVTDEASWVRIGDIGILHHIGIGQTRFEDALSRAAYVRCRFGSRLYLQLCVTMPKTSVVIRH